MTEPTAAELDRLVAGRHRDPHAILGAHLEGSRTVIRTLHPEASAVTAIVGKRRVKLKQIHDGGVFAGSHTGKPKDYRLEVAVGDRTHEIDDPYRWLPTLGEMDQHLISEGRHERLWKVLGAHVRRYETATGPVSGVSFAVWAPNARGVRVTGDFDSWRSRAYPLRALGSTGVWEIFVPGVSAGVLYKFAVLGADDVWRAKADPLAFAAEVPPDTASRVYESSYSWGDADWMSRREGTEWQSAPVSTYEVHLGSWKAGLSYDELADELVDYVSRTGFTHVELLPVMQHPYGGSWGYHVTSYFAPDSRFGDPDGLRRLIDRLHQAGIGVILDWVPGHFATDPWALARFDGTALYEHPDPQRGWHEEWGSHIFNFGRHEVRNFLYANALYWLEEFHADGLRVDGVASMLYLDYSRGPGQWTPNKYGGRENLEAVAFLQELNATVYRNAPGAITIAEESTSWPGVTRPTHLGGLGFGFKWNMGWMHDTLGYVGRPPIFRSYHHQQMTFSLMYAYSENFVLPISHDEVVHGKGSLLRKMPGDRWQQLANLRCVLAYMWAHPGKQLLFMGSEFAQDAEWAEGRSLDWWLLDSPAHHGVQQLVTDLNRNYRDSPAMWSLDADPAGFQWIDANDAASNVFSFLRKGAGGELMACVSNFAGVPFHGYRIGLPHAGAWTEVVNTDAHAYGGSGVGNLGTVTAVADSWHGQPASATVSLPPLGTLWLRPAPSKRVRKSRAKATAKRPA